MEQMENEQKPQKDRRVKQVVVGTIAVIAVTLTVVGALIVLTQDSEESPAAIRGVLTSVEPENKTFTITTASARQENGKFIRSEEERELSWDENTSVWLDVELVRKLNEEEIEQAIKNTRDPAGELTTLMSSDKKTILRVVFYPSETHLVRRIFIVDTSLDALKN